MSTVLHTKRYSVWTLRGIYTRFAPVLGFELMPHLLLQYLVLITPYWYDSKWVADQYPVCAVYIVRRTTA